MNTCYALVCIKTDLFADLPAQFHYIDLTGGSVLCAVHRFKDDNQRRRWVAHTGATCAASWDPIGIVVALPNATTILSTDTGRAALVKGAQLHPLLHPDAVIAG